MFQTFYSIFFKVDGADDIPQFDGEDIEHPEDEFMTDIPTDGTPPGPKNDCSTSSAAERTSQIDSRCPICDYPTKLHKTYHMATKHFADRLKKMLPTEKPFKCPDCTEYEAKTRINLWTHFLGKHQYSKKWTNEILGLPAGHGISPKKALPPPPYTSSLSKLQSLLEAKTEVKNEVVSLPTPNLAAADIIKTEIEQMVPMVPPQKPTTPAPSTPKSSKNQTESSKNRVEFWCDLCQKVIKFQSKSMHFATVHFEAKLKATLPLTEPFLCPLCNHQGKDFGKLTSHFFNRCGQSVLNEWIAEELDKMEDEIIAKQGNNIQLPQNIEELEDPEPKLEVVKNGKFAKHICEIYGEEPPKKKRKILKDLESYKAIKNIIDPNEKEMTSIDLDRNVPVSRDPIPVRIMTSQMVSKWYPEVPHEWVCDGKLLMLTDPHHPNNISLFQGKL